MVDKSFELPGRSTENILNSVVLPVVWKTGKVFVISNEICIFISLFFGIYIHLQITFVNNSLINISTKKQAEFWVAVRSNPSP